mmetsp:Transcript_17254/g.42808  ORF Transcript_17254/g.42808 Transcript_17254/m.42808 type:complete len:292 (+) Transcript_17254:51-926(+)|eukprot:CAMPEP_0178988408 /NCGR_PEP_ID=MMETSP0795-20121207/3796_1 /TAXON_ID=88552 /ORGANISM="Amoebophrya sp., Strain Ameob2" /LENGTH=291 /DNA_ID=CAMNT_0020679683 /DNA_START=75 /DNA_END=950 /DNA_ORIENTATION=+
MAEVAKDSFAISSVAKQHEGLRGSAPKWGFGSSVREQAQKVYISKSHSVDVLGIDSPGPVYGLSGATPGPKFGFGTNKRAGLENPNSYPPTSNDLLHIEQPLPDKYKHKRAGNAKIGTSLRTAQVNAPGLDGYAPGMLSPGPAQYTANFGSANRMPPAFTMASKTKTGASKYDVRPGPQAYSLPAGLGAQPNARKPSLPRYSFGKAPRFKNKIEAVSLAEPGGDHDGTLRLKFQRNAERAATWKLGSSTRQQQGRLAQALCPEDRVAPKEHPAVTNPSLPPRRDILRYTEI